ncbi:hypothetical protein ACFP1Z_10025 [Streptomyces gamaensis]|uniref:Secreted protein n=1 Tax=Streptomyces gamaensis TaxID=1763542 RepID=A0ABW0YXL3_9ACTN
MREFLRAAAVAACAAGAVLAVLPTAQAAPHTAGKAPAECRFIFDSRHPGPNGEISGARIFRDGDRDPLGRVCRDGWWVFPDRDHERDPYDHGRDWDHGRDHDRLDYPYPPPFGG